jgi:hypothetical protein
LFSLPFPRFRFVLISFFFSFRFRSFVILFWHKNIPSLLSKQVSWCAYTLPSYGSIHLNWKVSGAIGLKPHLYGQISLHLLEGLKESTHFLHKTEIITFIYFIFFHIQYVIFICHFEKTYQNQLPTFFMNFVVSSTLTPIFLWG